MEFSELPETLEDARTGSLYGMQRLLDMEWLQLPDWMHEKNYSRTLICIFIMSPFHDECRSNSCETEAVRQW